MYSTFEEEENINIYDKEFYEWCKTLKSAVAEEIVEWYDTSLKEKGELPNFTFMIFDEWKIQGYWYDEFVTVIKGMETFLKPAVGDYNGSARFMYEEGMPFEFRIDYKKKMIDVSYVPVQWEVLELVPKENIKIPKKILKKIEEKKVEEAI